MKFYKFSPLAILVKQKVNKSMYNGSGTVCNYTFLLSWCSFVSWLLWYDSKARERITAESMTFPKCIFSHMKGSRITLGQFKVSELVLGHLKVAWVTTKSTGWFWDLLIRSDMAPHPTFNTDCFMENNDHAYLLRRARLWNRFPHLWQEKLRSAKWTHACFWRERRSLQVLPQSVQALGGMLRACRRRTCAATAGASKKHSPHSMQRCGW